MERNLVDGSCNQSVEDKAEFLVSFQLATVITGHMQTVPFSVTSRFCRIWCLLHFKVPPVRIPAEKQLLEHTLQNVNLQQIRQSNYGATIWTRAVCSRPRCTGMEVRRNSCVTQRWIPPFIWVLKKAELWAKCSLSCSIIHNCLPVSLGVQFPLRLNPEEDF